MIEVLPNVGTDRTAEHGVGIVQTTADRPVPKGGLGCIFRRTSNSDYGIDGSLEFLVEHADQTVATGKIISIQIKTGKSYFSDEVPAGWRLYIPKKTFNYWRNHSVPVLLVLVDEDSGVSYFVRADDDHEETEKHYIIIVPKQNILNARARPELWKIAQNQSDADSQLARLENSFLWMQAVRDGHPIVIQIDDWINKSSGLKDITIKFDLSPWKLNHPEYSGVKDFEFSEYSMSVIGSHDVKAALQWVFPWGEIEQEIDEDSLYDSYLEDEGAWDSEEDRYVVYSEVTFEEWLEKNTRDDGLVRPEEIAGEVERYSFTIALNRLGEAYLDLRAFLYETKE
jgi:hypothetical protein